MATPADGQDGVGRLPTPLGDLVVGWRGAALVVADFADTGDRLAALLRRQFRILPRSSEVPHSFADAVSSYFGGDVGALGGVEVAPAGTGFQQRVWLALRQIPAGEVRTYGGLARSLGLADGAARAVGRANALNPVSIVIPCHRLTGIGGALTGYAGGLARKSWLLRHEGALR